MLYLSGASTMNIVTQMSAITITHSQNVEMFRSQATIIVPTNSTKTDGAQYERLIQYIHAVIEPHAGPKASLAHT